MRTAKTGGVTMPNHDQATAVCRGAAATLAELEARVRYELDCIAYPDADWVPRQATSGGESALDVLIVGAGQAGLATWFALHREGVRRTAIIDRAESGREGIWTGFARMPVLRTPKYLTGPDYGVPSLTFRAWYDASGLQPDWPHLGLIPTRTWMDYLDWFRRIVGAPVRNRCAFLGCTGGDGLLRAQVDMAGTPRTIATRKIVLATGMDGGGAWAPPPQFVADLPRAAWAHTADDIDFALLAGKRVAILGAGASAFDNAAMALAHGAASIDVFFRHSSIEKVEARAWLEHPGYLFAFGDLTDAQKWPIARQHLSAGAPPPDHAVARVRDDPRFAMHPGRAWNATRWSGTDALIDTSAGPFRSDFVIFATGAIYDIGLRPELAAMAPAIALWRDRHPPAADPAFADVGAYPYLGDAFQFTEKHSGEAPWLGDIHLFTWSATASLGVTGSSITGMKYGLRRLVNGLVRDLYRRTYLEHLAAMPWPGRRGAAPE
jgi:cation diffusion facilitator CzcD-associated flavoprotein CzcO